MQYTERKPLGMGEHGSRSYADGLGQEQTHRDGLGMETNFVPMLLPNGDHRARSDLLSGTK